MSHDEERADQRKYADPAGSIDPRPNSLLNRARERDIDCGGDDEPIDPNYVMLMACGEYGSPVLEQLA